MVAVLDIIFLGQNQGHLQMRRLPKDTHRSWPSREGDSRWLGKHWKASKLKCLLVTKCRRWSQEAHCLVLHTCNTCTKSNTFSSQRCPAKNMTPLSKTKWQITIITIIITIITCRQAVASAPHTLVGCIKVTNQEAWASPLKWSWSSWSLYLLSRISSWVVLLPLTMSCSPPSFLHLIQVNHNARAVFLQHLKKIGFIVMSIKWLYSNVNSDIY